MLNVWLLSNKNCELSRKIWRKRNSTKGCGEELKIQEVMKEQTFTDMCICVIKFSMKLRFFILFLEIKSCIKIN